MKINNRRYLGSKYKLLSFIKEVVENECDNINTFFDVFAGTGIVSTLFVDKTIILNDILYSNHLAHLTWFSSEKINYDKCSEIIKEYNSLNIDEDNYFSENFSNTFFSEKISKKIGHIREDIEKKYQNKKINDREKAILITSLIYASDKIANTCGHYEAYRRNARYNDNLKLEMPEFYDNLSIFNQCYQTDSNKLVKNIVCDLAYLDPPYNSRQYGNMYHVLENLSTWKKPPVEGVARKMDRSHLKSDYCTKKAPIVFDELIQNLNTKYILVSYNNTGKKANDRSNAKISDRDIIRSLSKRGIVKKFSKTHQAFSTGKSKNNNNEERLFLCSVKDDTIKSPLNYTGGKSKLIPQLKPLFPENITQFVDLFCGGANVAINTPAYHYYYNDISQPVIGLYKTFIKMEKEEIFSKIYEIIEKYNLSNTTKKGYKYYNCDSSKGLSSYNKDKFLKLREDFNKLKRKNDNYYLKFFVLLIYGFNNQIRFNSKKEYNLPVGKRDFNIKMRNKLSDFVDILKIQNPVITCKDFRKFKINKLDENSFVYCDPPYLITTATYNENGGWTNEDETSLLEYLNKLNDENIKFGLSNVLTHKGKTNDILKDWITENNYNMHKLDFNYKNSNYQSLNKNKKTEEILITNY